MLEYFDNGWSFFEILQRQILGFKSFSLVRSGSDVVGLLISLDRDGLLSTSMERVLYFYLSTCSQDQYQDQDDLRKIFSRPGKIDPDFMLNL